MLITETSALDAFCDELSGAPYVAVDTEFLREKTYYPVLCLVQVAGRGRAAAIDTLAPGLDLTPLWDLMSNPAVVKVFHSASQDLAILLQEGGALPAPVYDTQIASAFCGYGEQPSYATLAARIAGADIDKSSQMTDWTRRPLTDRQLAYALSDVEHLCPVYEHLVSRLESLGRAGWVAEEMAALAEPGQYEVDPREQWRRIRIRRPGRRTLAVLREIAAWREESARTRNLPRGWVLKDDVLAEIAATRPETPQALERVRNVTGRFAGGDAGSGLLEAVRRGAAVPEADCPTPPPARAALDGQDTLVALLQALLKARCEEHGIAPPMVANRADLDRIAAEDEPVVRAFRGWRRELFGEDALALKCGRVALTATGSGVSVVPVPGG